MTVNIEAAALSMPESIDSLKLTPLVMHRITFMLPTAEKWYSVMKEARVLYGKNWRSQPHVKRKLEQHRWKQQEIPVWFEVPDQSFASWCAVKLAVEVKAPANK
jgi:hypothetical protein